MSLKKNKKKVISAESVDVADWNFPSVTDKRYHSNPFIMQEINALKEQARTEAYNSAYAEVKANAEAEIGQQIRESLAILAEPIKLVDNQIEDEILMLASTLAKKVIHKELTQDVEPLKKAIAQALPLLPCNQMKIKLSVNPIHFNTLQQFCAEAELNNEIELHASEEINNAAAKIETANSVIDIDLCAQIDSLVSELMQADVSEQAENGATDACNPNPEN